MRDSSVVANDAELTSTGTRRRAGPEPGSTPDRFLDFRLVSFGLRRLVLPKRIDAWSLTSLQQRLVQTGGRLVKHARYYWLLLAEGHLHRHLFGQMLGRISVLPVPSG